MSSPITAANLELQMALQAIMSISEVILKSSIFNPILDGKKIKYMEDIYNEASGYQLELQKVGNRLNIELFGNINQFLINQHKMLQKNIGFFNYLFNNPQTNTVAAALIPILKNYFLRTEKAIEQFNVLKKATMSQLNSLNDSEILEETRNKIHHADQGLNSMLACLISIKQELHEINKLANFPIGSAVKSKETPSKTGKTVKHKTAEKPHSKAGKTVKFSRFNSKVKSKHKKETDKHSNHHVNKKNLPNG